MSKKSFIIRLFDDIAPTYDRLNHLLSFNIDRSWRRRAIAEAGKLHPRRALDVACGTGDFTIELALRTGAAVTGIDISDEMLRIGRKKVADAGLTGERAPRRDLPCEDPGKIALEPGDCECLYFGDRTFDVVCCAFGVRNFQNLEFGLREMCRVLRPGGRAVVLELSVPSSWWLRTLYKGYFLHVLPRIGGRISGNYEAYAYLPQSVLKFPAPPVFMEQLRKVGFVDVCQCSLTCGLARIYCADKPLG